MKYCFKRALHYIVIVLCSPVYLFYLLFESLLVIGCVPKVVRCLRKVMNENIYEYISVDKYSICMRFLRKSLEIKP